LKGGKMDKVLIVLRQMQWKKAKGELEGMLETLWSDNKQEEEECNKLIRIVNNFIEKVENETLIA
jgi:hypothetical protein